MKIVELRRHSIRDESGHITQEGIALAKEKVFTLLDNYELFFTSPATRAIETMEAFGFKKYEIKDELGTYNETPLIPHISKINEVYREKGITKFAAMFEIPETKEILRAEGQIYYNVIKTIAEKLQPGKSAFIISHGGTIELIATAPLKNFHINEINGEASFCEGFRLYFDDNNSFIKVEPTSN